MPTQEQMNEKNNDFLVGAIKNMIEKKGQLFIAIGISADRKILTMTDNQMSNRDAVQLLRQSADLLEKNQQGRIILLN